MNSSASSPPPVLATDHLLPPGRILLVEDNEMGRQMVRTLLEHLHLDVVEAVDGADALAQVTAGNFDLVLMDIQMPVMDGIAAAKAIRKLEQQHKASVPIIAMTAYVETDGEYQLAQAGFNDCVTKPIELDTLCLSLRRWLPNLSILPALINIPLDHHTALQQALPKINVSAALSRSGGNVSLYRNLLKKFNKQFATSASQILQEIEAQNDRSACFIVHDLKGAAAALGAADLQICANDLEQQLTHHQKPVALNDTLVELQRFLKLIQVLPEQEVLAGNAVSGEHQGNCSELHSILLELRAPLAKLKIKQVNLLRAQLEQKQWPHFLAAQVHQLIQEIDNYHFSPAGELLETILVASSEPETQG